MEVGLALPSPGRMPVGPPGRCAVGHHRGMEQPLLRVAIAEDSVLLREGLVRLIEDGVGTVVAAVGDGPSFVAVVSK